MAAGAGRLARAVGFRTAFMQSLLKSVNAILLFVIDLR
jgi:hypothetical protein